MDLGLLLRPQALQLEPVEQDLADCNKALAPYGLSLTPEQMKGLVERRFEALRETQRVEFGRGIIPELITAFASSPYLEQDSCDATFAELQDIFYRLKEEGGEQVPDTELIDALRYLFDHEAQGAIEVLETLPAERLLEAVEEARKGGDAEWPEADAYEKPYESEKAAKIRDELDRVREQGVWERPGNEYAATFYDGAREVYRITADKDMRIGGSSLG